MCQLVAVGGNPECQTTNSAPPKISHQGALKVCNPLRFCVWNGVCAFKFAKRESRKVIEWSASAKFCASQTCTHSAAKLVRLGRGLSCDNGGTLSWGHGQEGKFCFWPDRQNLRSCSCAQLPTPMQQPTCTLRCSCAFDTHCWSTVHPSGHLQLGVKPASLLSLGVPLADTAFVRSDTVFHPPQCFRIRYVLER